MKFFEVIAYFVTAIGILLKVLHIPGANFFLICGLCSLAFAYLVAGFSAKTDASFLSFVFKVGGLSLGVAAIGILFRSLHWGNTLNMIGLISCGAVFLLAVLSKSRYPNHKDLSAHIFRLTSACIASLVVMFLI